MTSPATALSNAFRGVESALLSWLALASKPQDERSISQILSKTGLESPLPLSHAHHHWTGHLRAADRPLLMVATVTVLLAAQRSLLPEGTDRVCAVATVELLRRSIASRSVAWRNNTRRLRPERWTLQAPLQSPCGSTMQTVDRLQLALGGRTHRGREPRYTVSPL